MKKKNILWLVPMLALCSCGGKNPSASSNTTGSTMSLDEVKELLKGDLLTREISESNKVVFEETNSRGASRVSTTKETMNIYNDETTLAIGEEKYTVEPSTPGGEAITKEDTYKKLMTTETYSGQKVFYYVVDYEDGTLLTSWEDTAKRLPVVETGSSDLDGYQYLLSSSLPGQLTKQVSLIAYNFISKNLADNPDVQATMPFANVQTEGNAKTISLEDFSYSYDDEGTTVDILVEFELKITAEKLTNVSLQYSMTESRGEESYVTSLVDTYEVSYGTRAASSSDNRMISATDYFLEEVTEVQAFSYDNGEKEYLDINDLPLNKFIHFEAKTYMPAKAVDINLYAVASTNASVIAVSNNVFETKSAGVASVTIQSATGIVQELLVRVEIPEITRFTYVDSSSDIEVDSKTVGDETITTRYIYANTTYRDIVVSVRPSGALIDDVEIVVSDPDALEVEVESTVKDSLYLKYIVKNDNAEHKVDVTFRSKTNNAVSTTISYNIKVPLTVDEMYAKFMSHTYRWDQLHGFGDKLYALLTFTSRTEGNIKYYNLSDDAFQGEATFTYTFDGTRFTPVMTTPFSSYDYNGGDLTLDGEQITMRVNSTEYVHYFNVLEA